jgi:methionyl-tRNA formyltransferase
MSNKEFILSNTRIIFCGTPLIASKILQTLLDLKANVIACISQPDRELDRKKNIIFSETKKITIDNNIKLFQPEKISTIYNEINELKPDLIITCAYGQFITENILNIPKIGAINIHTSLLPELRGGAPIHHAIIKNKSKTGVSLMKMIKKMDAGDILFQKEVEISSEDTYDDLYLKLMQTSSDMIKDHLHDIISENYIPIVQNENKVTFALNIKLEETFINFDKPSKEIYNLIRGLCSKPCAKINFNNSIIKI